MANHKHTMPQERFAQVLGECLRREGGATRADVVAACEAANFTMSSANVTQRLRTINAARVKSGLKPIKLKDGRGRVQTDASALAAALGDIPEDALGEIPTDEVQDEQADAENEADAEESGADAELSEVSA